MPFHQPFTHDFLRADIYELLAPDLLHQLIKGVFKDHLVSWIMDYLHVAHGETAAFGIIEDIDHRFVMSKIFPSRTHTGLYSILAVPPFPGLQRFPDGRDYNQWKGDDSKALMKVCQVSWPLVLVLMVICRYFLLPLRAIYLLQWSRALQHSWMPVISSATMSSQLLLLNTFVKVLKGFTSYGTFLSRQVYGTRYHYHDNMH
jgi:hypothetical protein